MHRRLQSYRKPSEPAHWLVDRREPDEAVRACMRAARSWVRQWRATHGPPAYRAPNTTSDERPPQAITRVVLQVGATAEAALAKHRWRCILLQTLPGPATDAAPWHALQAVDADVVVAQPRLPLHAALRRRLRRLRRGARQPPRACRVRPAAHRSTAPQPLSHTAAPALLATPSAAATPAPRPPCDRPCLLHARRADLFRVLFLKAIGGVWADLDLELRTPLAQVLPPQASSVVSSTWNFAFLAYQPRHPLLQA